MCSHSVKGDNVIVETKDNGCQIGQFAASPGILSLEETPDVLFCHAFIILIPFPPSTHPSDLLPFFLLAWTLIRGVKAPTPWC